MDSLIERVSRQVSLLEGDFPHQIINADTPEAMKRGEAASQAIKTGASNLLPKTGLTTDLSKAFSNTSKRDFITSAYSKNEFFTNITQIGNQVFFVYFLTSTASESYINDLSNYYPIIEVSEEQLRSIPAVPMYRYLSEATNPELAKNLVSLPNMPGQGTFYKITDTLMIGIGTPGNYRTFISDVKSATATGSSELSNFASKNLSLIKTRVLALLRENQLDTVLSKHPLYSLILNSSAVMSDCVIAALVDFLNVNSIITRNTKGKLFPELLKDWTNNPHQKFYSSTQYVSQDPVKIPDNIRTDIHKRLNNVEMNNISLLTLLMNTGFSLDTILLAIHKNNSGSTTKSIQAVFTRIILTLSSIKKAVKRLFNAASDNNEILSNLLLNGTLDISTPSGRTNYLRISINPSNEMDKNAFYFSVSSLEMFEKNKSLTDNTESLFSKDRVNKIYIPQYSPSQGALSFYIPINLHKWIISDMQKSNINTFTGASYLDHVISLTTETSAATYGGPAGKALLISIFNAFFDSNTKGFTTISDKVNVIPPEFLSVGGINLLTINHNTFLETLVSSYPHKYTAYRTTDSFITAVIDYLDIGTTTTQRPIFIAKTANTPAVINIFDLKIDAVDTFFFDQLKTNYKSTEDIKNSIIQMGKASGPASEIKIRDFLNVLFSNAVLGYYGDDSTLFLATAFKAESSTVSFIEFAVELSNSDKARYMDSIKAQYGGR